MDFKVLEIMMDKGIKKVLKRSTNLVKKLKQGGQFLAKDFFQRGFENFSNIILGPDESNQKFFINTNNEDNSILL